jgi:hypothetical protein
MSDFGTRIKAGCLEGIKKGWASFVWMGKIIIPLSLIISLLQWTGWLHYLYFLLTPLTRLINLPPEAAIPLLSGMLINIYAAIAVITVMPFSIGQMTLIAVFSLIAHNMILEGTIQHKSGINWAKISLIRIVAAIATVLIISRFFGDTTQSITPVTLANQAAFPEVLKGWALSTFSLLLKIFILVMLIMVVLGCLQSLNWTQYVLKVFRPLGKIFGLDDRTMMMFMAAVIFGLLYGGAVIVEESKKQHFSKEELEYLHISIGINHSMVEDPALFVVIGLNWFWVWIPKLLVAIAAVHAYRGFRYIKKKAFRPQTA